MPRSVKVVSEPRAPEFEDFRVLVDLGDEVLGLVFGPAVLLQSIAPSRDVVPARAARGLRIGRHDLDAVLDEIRPVMNPLGIALPHQEHDGRGVGGRVIREPLLPVGRDEPAVLGKLIDVAAQGQRYDVGLEPVDHGARLLARAAVRLLNRHVLASLRLPPSRRASP